MDTKYYSDILLSKIPSYIVEDVNYKGFTDFLQYYYNWFNETYNISSVYDSIDIDKNYYDFLSYFKADFLPYIPEEIAADKIKLIKIARDFYKAKGTPDSFKFLFRALYDSYCEVIPTRNFVLKASDGKWLVPKSVKIKSNDPRFFQTKNYKLFGTLSKTFGIIDTVQYSGKYIQIFLSNIERLYFSGEPIKILDFNNAEVSFDGEFLSSKIIGSISSVDINPKFRGQKYKVGDPVSIIGGLNPEIDTPVGATAYISKTTLGAIRDVTVNNGGYGFLISPNTSIDVIYNNQIDNAANCIVSLVDYTSPANTTYFPLDIIETNANVPIGNTIYNFFNSANANTTLANSFFFDTFTTYPITGITVIDGGGGYEIDPTLSFNTNIRSRVNTDISLVTLGILAPITIDNPGIGYTANDSITISGGTGDFAFAKIDTVDSSGRITSVSYHTANSSLYTLGGLGYTQENLPTVSISSLTGSNAVLSVKGILGTGVDYSLVTDKVGQVTQITLSDNGEDYITAPNVSLRVQDIAVSNVSSSFSGNTVIYQGSLQTPTYFSYYDLIELITTNNNLNPTDYTFNLRVYDYSGSLNYNQPLYVYSYDSKDIISNLTIDTSYNSNGYVSGIKTYGDGSAKATAKFLNGLIIGEGMYLNTDGQPSSYSVLQSDIYNNSTYFLSSELSYDSYKETVLNMVHPFGFRLYPKNLIRSKLNLNYNSSNSKIYLSNSNSSIVLSVVKSNTNYSNCFSYSTNSDKFVANSRIFISTNNAMNVYSTITYNDSANSKLYLDSYVQYIYPNVYTGLVSSNTISIQTEEYIEPKYTQESFIFVNDSILTPNNSINKIISIANNILYFQNNFTNQYTDTAVMVGVIKDISSNNSTTYISN